jgi:hypothetical protein
VAGNDNFKPVAEDMLAIVSEQLKWLNEKYN